MKLLANLIDSLIGGHDHELAERYADQESATERASRKRREGHRLQIPEAARRGQTWEDADRARERRGGRGRGRRR